ncbi:hypothetical protein F4775DRAFT_531043 [Biscogniauxia sp. FL1348]|nr:hypothetical protein F4775DRAFT_531043 [Biscogniauxia sp. FL1348]
MAPSTTTTNNYPANGYSMKSPHTPPVIRRKPVPTPSNISDTPSSQLYGGVLDDLLDDYLDPLSSSTEKHEPTPESTKEVEVEMGMEVSAIRTREWKLDTPPPLPRRQLSAPLVSTPSVISTTTSTGSSTEATGPSRSMWKTAVDETLYFAGGLISHPFESTKHFSILRHSPGLVLYKGPSTSVTISIFGDKPTPADRTLWLQRKGYSGNMGMAASAMFGTTGNWIDVTPSFEAQASDIPEPDERGIQRDIKKFSKRAAAAGNKRLAKHIIQETCMVRIPASASDGYMRIVMCTGEGSKKTLCPSPVFRIASMSSDVSVLRGASLTTMPLEIGLKVASTVGTQVVQRYVGPAQAIVQTGIKRLQPGFFVKEAEKVTLVKSGLREQFTTLESNFDASRDVRYDPFHEEGTLEAPPDIIGPDSGPEAPFPIHMSGKVTRGTGRGLAQSGIPTANLTDIPKDLLLRLNGIYIGWAAVMPNSNLDASHNDWCEAIITVGPCPHAPPRVVTKSAATVHLIHDFRGATFFDAKLRVVIMAFLRPAPAPGGPRPPAAEAAAALTRDADIAVASLSRANWQPATTLDTLQSQKTIAEHYVDVRAHVQRRVVDSVPLHLAGVRTAGAERKDPVYGRGGLYIRR